MSATSVVANLLKTLTKVFSRRKVGVDEREVSAPSVGAPLSKTLAEVVAHLEASADERHVVLLAGLQAAQCEPRLATCIEHVMADSAVNALALARAWHAGDGADSVLCRELTEAAEQTFAAVGKTMPIVNDPAHRARAIARVALFFDAEYPPGLARIIAQHGAEAHETEFSCQPKGAPVELIPAVAGKQRRLLAINVSASPYAPTGELIALPSQKFLAEIDSAKGTHALQWKPAGWCDAPTGEGIAFRYLGRIPSNHSVETMSILI